MGNLPNFFGAAFPLSGGVGLLLYRRAVSQWQTDVPPVNK